MIGTPLDRFVFVSTFTICPLMIVVSSARGQIVLSMLLAAIWFAWHTEKDATS